MHGVDIARHAARAATEISSGFSHCCGCFASSQPTTAKLLPQLSDRLLVPGNDSVPAEAQHLTSHGIVAGDRHAPQ